MSSMRRNVESERQVHEGRVLPPMTLDDAQRLDEYLSELITQQPLILSLADAGWVPKYLRRSGIRFHWSEAYELPLDVLLMLMAKLTEQDIFLEAINKKGSTYADLLNTPDAIEASATNQNVKKRVVVLVLACLVALVHSVRAIGLHSLSMHELATKGLKGDPLALRRAVAVDPSVLAAPSVSAYVSGLLRRGMHKELKQLYRAAANGPNKELKKYSRLRYFERMVSEGDLVEAEGKEAVFRLVTERLHLHTAGGSDPFKNLFTTFERWRENATT